jgi:hypothetical protein
MSSVLQCQEICAKLSRIWSRPRLLPADVSPHIQPRSAPGLHAGYNCLFLLLLLNSWTTHGTTSMRGSFRSRALKPLTKQAQARSYAAVSQASPIRLQNHPAPHSGTIRVLLLDRPEARNALSRQLMTELRRHVDEIKAEGGTGGTRALVIASNVDKAFCAGADLKERRGMSQDE